MTVTAGPATRSPRSSSASSAKTTDARPRGPNQPTSAAAGRPSPAPASARATGGHPDHGQAEHGVQHELPGQAFKRPGDGDSAEREPDQQRHQSPGLLDEWYERLAAPPRRGAERQAARERGDEAGTGFKRGGPRACQRG